MKLVTIVATLVVAVSLQDARALDALRAAALAGDAKAQLDYAKATKNTPGARDWAQKAADQGLAEAWFWLGYTAPGDTALPFYEKAADGGYPEAFSYLLDGLLFRAGEKADVVKAKKFADLARKLNIGSVHEEALTTVDRCFDAGSAEIPVVDRPTRAEVAAFAPVECARILEGVGQPADEAKYGRCALSQEPLEHKDVAEVYANGFGVKRSASTAIAFLCHGSDVPAELNGMVDLLYMTRAKAELAEEFRFCDHVTSGYNQARCAASAEASAAAKRDAEVATLTATWPQPHKTAFEKLTSAADAFFTARSGSEIDTSGTAGPAMSVGEESRLRDEWLGDVRGFESGKLPAPLDLKTADARLNTVYAQIMNTRDLALGTVTKAGIRETQRTWIAFRDAWAAFGVARYPRTTVDGWKAWATSRRVAQLEDLLNPR